MGDAKPAVRCFASGKFCDWIAHELANPLHGMLWSVEAMEKYLKANPPAMEAIGDLPGYLKEEIKRLIVLLSQLRSSGVLVDINLRPTSLPEQIRKLLAVESNYYKERGIRIDLDLSAGLPLIMADRDKLKQVILNLCNNAVEAMPNGGSLRLRSYTSGGWLCLDIGDTGGGIPEAMRVFEPAVTNKPQSNGLGLAIVREIIKQHKGRISYTSRLREGTTFHLKFPIEARRTVERTSRNAPACLSR